jgi:hypothetical protein
MSEIRLPDPVFKYICIKTRHDLWADLNVPAKYMKGWWINLGDRMPLPPPQECGYVAQPNDPPDYERREGDGAYAQIWWIRKYGDT